MIRLNTKFLYPFRKERLRKLLCLLLLLLPVSVFAHSGGVWIANDGCGNWYAIVFHYHNGSSAGSISATAKAGMYIDFDQNGVFDVGGVQYAYTNAAGFTTSDGDFTRFTDWIDLTDKNLSATNYANDAAIQNEVLAWLNTNKNFGKTYSLTVAISSASNSTWYEALVCPIKPLSPGVYKASTSTSSAVESPTGYTNPFSLNYTPTNFTGTLTTQSTCGETLKLDAQLTQTCVEEYGLVYSVTNTLPGVGGVGVSQQSLWTGEPTDLTNAALNYTIPVTSADEIKTHYIRTYYKQNVGGTAFYVYSPLISAMPLSPDADCDGDGLSNGTELAATPTDEDTDSDGIPDYRDLDSDSDGVADNSEGDTADCDADGIKDFQDLSLNPDFKSQPSNMTVCSGAETSFIIKVTGGGLSYQWQVNDGTGFTDITDDALYSGSTTYALSVTAASPGFSGYTYRCIVRSSNCATESASNTATLTVQSTSAPVVTNATYLLNSTAQSISANATGTGLLYYTEASGGVATSVAPTPSTAATGIQEFWITQTVDECESPRAKVTITINPPNEISGSETNKPAWFATTTIVDEAITISGEGTITDPKAYIGIGFANGDVLAYSGTLPDGITLSFDNATGSLQFTGSGNAETWQSILRGLTFMTTSADLSDRGINFVIGDTGNDSQLKVVHTRTLQYDAPPTATLSSSAYSVINAAYDVSFSFSEAVTGFTQDDISVTNAVLSSFTAVSASEYTATITPQADGEVQISVPAEACTDNILSPNTASDPLSRLYDATRPSVTLSSIAPDPLNAPFEVTVTFSESVSGFGLEDIAIVNGAKSDLKAVSKSIYSFLIAPTADGVVDVDLSANVVHDTPGNENTAATRLTRLYDHTKPTVEVSSTSPSNVNEPFSVTFAFSEPVSGFDINDIAVANGAPSLFTQVSETEYSVTITAHEEGQVIVSAPADAALDAATNASQESNYLTRAYDPTPPAGYAAAFGAAQVNVSNVHDVSITVNGAEAGTTFVYEISAPDGSVVRGTGQVVNGSFQITGVDVTSLPDGNITLSLYLKDEAGNKGAVTSAVVTKVTRNIVSVTPPAAISVPIRTTYAQVPLTLSVEVTYSTNEKQIIGVTWGPANYNGLVAGQYTLSGELILASGTTNLQSIGTTLQVTVEKNIAPTGISISNRVFAPSITTEEVIGMLTTEDEDDTEFTYELVDGAGSTDNALFMIDGDNVYLINNHGLSGRTQFSIRVRSTDPYQNTVESVFALQKADYNEVDIRIPTTFSPNGDGINDTWVPAELRFYNDVVVEVFDRSGVRLFRTTDPEAGWDGRANGGKELEGPFFYVIHIGDLNITKKGVLINLR